MGLLDFLKRKKEEMTSVEIPVRIQESAAAVVQEKKNEEVFRVAGVSFYEKKIVSMAFENDTYSLSKTDLIDSGFIDEKVYKLDFDPSGVEIIPEPDNPEDPKAMKVVVDGVHVGYIKKGKTGRIRNLLKKQGVKISASIAGGKYKYVSEHYDDYRDKEVYEMDTGNDPFYISLTVTWDNAE